MRIIEELMEIWPNEVYDRYLRGPDSSMVENLVQFQKGLGSSPSLVTFHAAIKSPRSSFRRALSFTQNTAFHLSSPTCLCKGQVY